MKTLQTFFKISIITILLLTACGDDKPSFELDESKFSENFTTQSTLDIKIKALKKDPIDSIQVFLGNHKQSFKSDSGQISLEKFKFGTQGLSVNVFSKDKKESLSSKVLITSHIKPQLISYELVNTYPHENNAYTQGFEFYNGQLYEGTGQRGRSNIRITDFTTGKVIKMENLPSHYFGEGITILKDTLYQLTWQEQKCIVYDAKTLTKIKELSYPQMMEGWGLTNDGQFLYMSDGSENLHRIDPKTFKILETTPIYSKDSPISKINELEWVDGKIYANVYQKDSIIVINPKTGSVENIIYLAELSKKIDFSTKHPQDAVLNGIAYHPQRKTFFVTGKDWEKTFEIRLN